MFEMLFLMVLALVWIVFASIQDLREREVANWLNFSLIIFALGFRFFYSLFEAGNFAFFYQGLIGLGIFLVVGNALYYGRMFAGGDAKLMIALGAVIGFSPSFSQNIKDYSFFLVLFLVSGALYGLVWSFVLILRNPFDFKKEFANQLRKNKKFIYPVMVLGLLFMSLGFVDLLIFYLGILIFLMPYLFFSAKAIEEVCMVKKIKVSKLTEGDWLYEDVKIGKKNIKAHWEGLNKEQIKEIQKKYKEVKVKQGIPFVPVFLISYLIYVYFWFY
jgi:Flp pilus assembly protein protease CpaA